MSEEFKNWWKCKYKGFYSNGADKRTDFSDYDLKECWDDATQAERKRLDNVWHEVTKKQLNDKDKEIEQKDKIIEQQSKEIYDLNNEKNAIIATQKLLLKTRFNEGLQVGLVASKNTMLEFNKAKENYLNENEKLTNELLRLEDIIEQQAIELEALCDFAVWLTGCGYDFTKHQYFLNNRHLLASKLVADVDKKRNFNR